MLLEPNYTCQEGACSSWQFTAVVFLLQHKGAGVKKGFQATLYVASAMQTATIEKIVDKVSNHQQQTLLTSHSPILIGSAGHFR